MKKNHLSLIPSDASNLIRTQIEWIKESKCGCSLRHCRGFGLIMIHDKVGSWILSNGDRWKMSSDPLAGRCESTNDSSRPTANDNFSNPLFNLTKLCVATGESNRVMDLSKKPLDTDRSVIFFIEFFFPWFSFWTYSTSAGLCCCGSKLSGWRRGTVGSSWLCCSSTAGYSPQCARCLRWSHGATEVEVIRCRAALTPAGRSRWEGNVRRREERKQQRKGWKRITYEGNEMNNDVWSFFFGFVWIWQKEHFPDHRMLRVAFVRLISW